MQRPDFYYTGNSENEQAVDVFESSERMGRNKFYGVILDIQKEAVHYGKLHKAVRSVFHGEPYQMMKNGKNNFGNTASYVYLRIAPVDGYGDAKDVICYNDRINLRVGDEVEISAKKCRNGSYIANKIYVVNTGAIINARAFTIPANIIRIFAIIIPIFICWMIYSVYSFIVSRGLIAIFNAMLPVLIILIGIYLVIRSVFQKYNRRR